MTDRKPELPEHAKVFEDALWDNSSPAVEAEDYEEVYEALRVSLTKLAVMEELLRSDRIDGLHLHCVTDFETDTGRHIDTRCVRCKRIDALLEGK
jgi:hypothetical protein